jgi:L-lactate dehydrogenase complex protein LldG
MSSRENILNAIAANQPTLVPLPVIERSAVIEYKDYFLQFKTVLESIGGKIELIPNLDLLKEKIRADKDTNTFIIDTITGASPEN